MLNLKKLNFTILLVTILVLVPTIQIVYASPLSTFYLSGGIYPSARTYTVWREGSNYYAKNAYGFQPSYSGSTNATQVFLNTFQNNSEVWIKAGTYLLTDGWGICVHNIHDLKVHAEFGTVFKKQEDGVVGQIIQISEASSNIVFEGITFDQDRDNPNHDTAGDYGLQWNVRVVGDSEDIYFYNCKFINGEQCLFVVGASNLVTVRDSFFDKAGEHPVYVTIGARNVLFDNCDFYNWGKAIRGYVKIDHSSYVTFNECYFDGDEDGLGLQEGSYDVVVGEFANHTTFENCFFVPRLALEAKGNNTEFYDSYFVRIEGEPIVVLRLIGNSCLVDNCKFLNWTYRCIEISGEDARVVKCYFSGGVSSSLIDFGNRTSVIECDFEPDNTHGNYGVNDNTGTGLFAFNHVCNSTLTFVIPENVTEAYNLYY